MTEEQLKIWLLDKYNSCYPVKHDNVPNSIYMYYYPNFIRAKKLANILNKEIEYPTEVKGVCLFHIDYDDMVFWCDYTNIWSIINDNYSIDYIVVRYFIKDCLKSKIKLNELQIKYVFGFIKGRKT